MAETKKIRGIIAAVSQQEDRFGIRIRGQPPKMWFNGFGICQVEKGEEVEIEYEEKETDDRIYRNISKVNRIEKETEKEPFEDTDSTIERTETKVSYKDYPNIEEGLNKRTASINAANIITAEIRAGKTFKDGELIAHFTELAKAIENYIAWGDN